MNPAIKNLQQSVAEIFIRGLEDGTSQWVKPWSGETIPSLSYNPISGVQYRGGNQMILTIAEWLMSKRDLNPTGDRRWMTYKQAAAVGAQVRKGEKSQMLTSYKEIEDRRGVEPGKDPVRRLVAFPFFVFHASQIDGLPPPQVPEPRPLDERMAQAQQIVDDLGVPVLPGGNVACYVPSKDRILMPAREAFHDDPSWMATLLHECAHATGHTSRLDRKFSFDRKGEEYAREELRAEMSSFDMCRRLGVPYDPSQHIAYVNSWVQILKKDPAELMRAAADADRILKFLKVPEPEIEKIPLIEQAKEQEQQREQNRGRATEPEREPDAKLPKAREKRKQVEASVRAAQRPKRARTKTKARELKL